jgi:hypothetical protein
MAVKNIFLKCPKSGGAGAPPATMAPPPLILGTARILRKVLEI